MSWEDDAPWPDDDDDQCPFVCAACEDIGFMQDEDGFVVPCSECSNKVTLEDLKEFRG